MTIPRFLAVLSLFGWVAANGADITAITDQANYNAGAEVLVRLQPGKEAIATIRYSGEDAALANGIRLSGDKYEHLWTIPWDARTGRYEVDLQTPAGAIIPAATSFAVHRQVVKVTSVEFKKTFYTSGDSVGPLIVVRNVSNQQINNLQVEFEPYTYPWIAPAPDDPKMWKHIVAQSLSLNPGEEKHFDVTKAAVVQADKEPGIIYYSVVVRDSHDPDRIYDLAFAPAIFSAPPNTEYPKQYPFLYLYWHLSDVPRSEVYRHFYPARFVSNMIEFDTNHTMFPTGVAPVIIFHVNALTGSHANNAALTLRLLNHAGKELSTRAVRGPFAGQHQVTLQPLPASLYTAEVLLQLGGVVTATNQIEIAINPLPKSILVFCAHEDDDTAHPGIIRAAVENHIPIHFVYWTNGDAGGCDRFYMHSCDAARAMDFGEVRMAEARASLEHMGVTSENIAFLGLPDGGLAQIWDHHLKASDPYLSVLTATDHSPYRESAIPNLPYARESAIAAAKQFILRFTPEVIITGHPDERHVDHRTNNWIVVKAMQELLHQGAISPDTKLIVDVSYGAMPQARAPYRFEKQTFHVSGEAARIGQEATWYYESQDGNHQQAEIIPFEKLPRTEPNPHYRILDWQQHEGWNEPDTEPRKK